MDIKRFALTATASALFAFHSEMARAASCPPQIIHTALADEICEFDAITGSSLTVENGGSVGGITMTNYNPASGQMVINSGGLVANTTGVGINLDNSRLANGLINNGTISNTVGEDIDINHGSIIDGGFSNSGLMSSGGISMVLDNSTINGGIFNSGTIRSETHGTGINILSTSTVQGGITNSGTIQGSDSDCGISILSNSQIYGDIINEGLIDSLGTGAGTLVNNARVRGGIFNSGTMSSVGNAGLALQNVSLVDNDIYNSGTISGGDQGILMRSDSVVSGSISNSGKITGGTIGIAVANQAVINHNLSNSGIIEGGNTGISVTSTSSIIGSISNSGVIQGDTNAINIESNSPVGGGINILGQHARLIGAVTAAQTDFNITSGALFTSEGTFNVKSFNIASNAIFNMANIITATDGVNNAGTLSVGNNLQTIAGSYTQDTGGIFQTDILNTTSYGQLISTDTVDLSQSGNINVQLEQNASIHSGDVFSNVINGNTLTAPTDGFNVTDNSFIWNFIADTTSTGVNLTSTINPLAYDVCHGTYCQGAANTIINQVAAGNSAFSPYALLSTSSAFQVAASQATPELTNENIQALQFITRSVMDVVPMWKMLHGESAGSAMLYQPGKVWVKPYGGSISQDKNNSVPGFNATAYGMVIGRDIQLKNDGLFGAALAAGRDGMHGKSTLNGQSIYSDNYQGILYGTRQLPHHLYLAGQGLIGYDNSNTKRSIPLYSSTAKGSYGSWFSNLRAQLGWNLYATQNLIFTPELDASYLFVNQRGYKESGSTMDLWVHSSNNSSLILGGYGNGAYRLTTSNKQQEITFTGYAGVARNMLNSQPITTATFAVGGPSFSTQGAQFNGLVFRGGVGLNVASTIKPVMLSFNYDLQAGNNAFSGAGSLTVSYKI